LITEDELRAAGALDVPAAWRKSLGEERDLFSELTEDDDQGFEKNRSTQIGSAPGEPADELP
jgi:hypothetical protein